VVGIEENTWGTEVVEVCDEFQYALLICSRNYCCAPSLDSGSATMLWMLPLLQAYFHQDVLGLWQGIGRSAEGGQGNLEFWVHSENRKVEPPKTLSCSDEKQLQPFLQRLASRRSKTEKGSSLSCTLGCTTTPRSHESGSNSKSHMRK